MVTIEEALKEHISSSKAGKISPSRRIIIVEDKVRKISERMYALEFLVRVSENNLTLQSMPSLNKFQRTYDQHAYESEALLNPDDIIKSEFYDSMNKFRIDTITTVDKSYVLRLPKKILVQYLGDDEFMKCKKQKGLITDDFILLCGRDVTNKDIILIPKKNFFIMSNMNNSARKFLDYFGAMEDANIVSTTPSAFILKGVPSNIRQPRNEIRFFSDNQVYIHLEKIYDD